MPRNPTAPWPAVLLGTFLGWSAAAGAQTVIEQCGNVPNGRYELGANLEATGDCLVLVGGDVVIDFRGRTIQGDGSGAAVTDDGDSFSNIILSNGKIRGFGTGIDLASSDRITIEGMKISDNLGRGIWIEGDNNHISSVQSDDNGADGIFVAGCCNTVTDCSASGNGLYGIRLIGGSSTLTDSRAMNNTTGGLFLFGGGDHVIRGFASGNEDHGISARQGTSFIKDSKSQKNAGHGVFMDDGGNHVLNTQASNNGGDGFRLEDGSNQVTGSKATKNAGAGFDFGASPDNFISDSQAKSNGGAGVDLACPGNVSGLKASGNDGGNLVISAGTCTELGNKAP